MTDTVTARAQPAVPSARQVRVRLRRLRRNHRSGSLGDVLADLYLVLLLAVVYGGGGVYVLRDYFTSPEVVSTATGARWWIGVAAVVAGAGLTWQGVRMVGPLLASPATMTWIASSPVDRRAWLVPRFMWSLAGAAAGSALLGVAAVVAVRREAPAVTLTAVTVAVVGGAVAGVALGVVAQAEARPPVWSRHLGPTLVAVGSVAALVAVVAELAGRSLPTPTVRWEVAAVATVPVAVAATVAAVRALSRIDRASLATGAQLASAAMVAALSVDPTWLTSVVEARRWRAVGRVRSRRQRPGSRWWVLLRADLRRPLRRPGVLLWWVLLGLGCYAVTVALPPLGGAAHLALAYLAGGALAGGLRMVCRSAGLRRALGGRDGALYAVHLVLPTLGVLVWYLLTLPVVRPQPTVVDAVFVAGLVVAVYRTASRPPMRYGGVVWETPFGLIPVDLVSQVVRGPDVVVTMILFRLMFV